MKGTWFAKVRDGRVTVCPVCKGKLVPYNPLESKYPIWFECVDCEWNDEIQDLCDFGHYTPRKGWPLVIRKCVLCGAESDGMELPSVELTNCRCGGEHTVCNMRGLKTPPGCQKAVFGMDKKRGHVLDVCPVGGPP